MKCPISSLSWAISMALLLLFVAVCLPSSEAGSAELGWVRDDSAFNSMPQTHINVTFNVICTESQCFRVNMNQCAMLKSQPMLICATDAVAYRLVPETLDGESGKGSSSGNSPMGEKISVSSDSSGSHVGVIAVVVIVAVLSLLGAFYLYYYYRFVKYH